MCAGALWTVVTRIVPWLRIDVVPVYRALGVELLLALAYAVVVTRVSSPAWRAVCLGLLIWALTYRGLVALLAAAAGVSWRLVRRRLWSMPDEALVDALHRAEMPLRRRGALPRELIVHLIRRLEEVAREYEIASTRAWRTRVPIVDVEVRRWVRSVIGMIRALQIGMALNAISPEGVSTRLQTIMEAVATRDLAPGAQLGRDKIWDNPPMFTNHLGGWVRGRRYLSRIGWALCAFATAVAGLTVLATSVWPAVPHEMVRAGWPWLGHVLTFDADVRVFTAGVGLSLLAVAQRTWSRARRW
jgi:hypothetical protein